MCPPTGGKLIRPPRSVNVETRAGRAALSVTAEAGRVEVLRELRLFGGHASAQQAPDLRALREALREMNGATLIFLGSVAP